MSVRLYLAVIVVKSSPLDRLYLIMKGSRFAGRRAQVIPSVKMLDGGNYTVLGVLYTPVVLPSGFLCTPVFVIVSPTPPEVVINVSLEALVDDATSS